MNLAILDAVERKEEEVFHDNLDFFLSVSFLFLENHCSRMQMELKILAALPSRERSEYHFLVTLY